MTSDAELIEGCKKGKHSAFEALYTKYARRLMAIAMRYCNTTFEAEDVVQETFVKAFNKINEFESKNSFEGWIKRILVNLAINHYRDTQKERWLVDVTVIEISEESAEDAFSKISNGELLELLKKLPFGYKTVFNLYAIEGYSHKEIAEMMGIQEDSCRSQFRRAKEMLRELVLKNSYVSNEGE